MKYKVEIKKKGYRKPKMTRHAKNTSCLDIIKGIRKVNWRKTQKALILGNKNAKKVIKPKTSKAGKHSRPKT